MTTAPNPSSSATSGTAAVHPLVLLNISEHITRSVSQNQAQFVFGALLGKQKEKGYDVSLSFEMKFASDVCQAEDFDVDHCTSRLDLMKQNFPEDGTFLGWYAVVGQSVGGMKHRMLAEMHQRMMSINPSALLLVFDATFKMEEGTGVGKHALPIVVYETMQPTRVARSKISECWEEGSSEDAEYFVEALSTNTAESAASVAAADMVNAARLVPLELLVDSGEAERVAIDHVAYVSRVTTEQMTSIDEAVDGSAKEGNNTDAAASSHLATFLVNQRNAVEMLSKDLEVLGLYVAEVIDGKAQFDAEVMQLIQMILSNRSVVQDDKQFDSAMAQGDTNFQMARYLSSVTSAALLADTMLKRANVSLASSKSKHRAYVNVSKREEGEMDPFMLGGRHHEMMMGGSGRRARTGRHR